MTKCNATPEFPQRAYLRLKLIKEAQDPLQQSEAVAHFLGILKAEDGTKQIVDQWMTAINKKEMLLSCTKQQVYSWLQAEFQYLRSIRDQTQHCIERLLDKAEGYISGKIGEFESFGFVQRRLWEQLWNIYEEICFQLIQSGYSHLTDGRTTTYVREKVIWKPNLEAGVEQSDAEETPPPFLMAYTPELCFRGATKPECINNLLRLQEAQDKRQALSGPVELLISLSFISSLHNTKFLEPDLSKGSWAEYLKLKPSPTPLELDERMVLFSNQFRIYGLLQNPCSFLKMVTDLTERFVLFVSDKMSEIKAIQGPKQKSHLSKLAHDWFYPKMHQFFVDSMKKGHIPTLEEMTAWAKNLQSLPEHLKGRNTPYLFKKICKEIFKTTGHRNRGGRHRKEKTPSTRR